MNTTTRSQRTSRVANSGPAHGHLSGRSQTASLRLRHRLAAIVLIAVAAFAAPHPAAALMPLPPPPVRFPVQDVARTVLALAEAYGEAPLTEKRQLHNDMLLALNTAHAAL